ncbi:hypothetical protein NVIE_010880 [Nitrososphaera viennensis EN76]|uniref:Uncharacterized protein n=1 Tax=Nitrososphaera viennensis EN76 TaxID=926571 RepID=A0A060HQ57_9ARCH|nr:hypothetical protein NVIE_010880 [Nitrososphaera viennensis EN76]
MAKSFEIRAIGPRPQKVTKYMCFYCTADATTEALFQMGNVILMRRYCDQCLPNAEI